MLHPSKIWLTAGLFVLALFLLTGSITAGDNKPEDKKVATKKVGKPKSTGALLNKTGELKEDDEKDATLKSSPSQKISIKLTAGITYQIDLKSKDFDSFLRLEDPSGKEVAFDDDGGGYPDAQITYKALKTGNYKIVVTSFPDKTGKFAAFGKYNLTVIEAAPIVGNSRFQGATTELKLVDGKISSPAELDKNKAFQGFFFKVFTVNLEKGKTYRIDHMDAGDKINPVLLLENADGDQLESDGGRGDARIIFKAIKTGTYRLVATTGRPGTVGRFIVEIAPETDAKLLKEADLRFRINTIASLTKADQKALAEEVSKRLLDADGDLTIADARLVFQLGMEAESEDVNLARSVYKDAVKYFSAAKDEKITRVTPQFEDALKNLEKVGKMFEITGKTIAGKEFDLKDLKGKVVLIDFWGTWCGPCVAEVPNIIRNYEKYHSKGFDVIGVSSDKQDDVVVQFLKAKGVPWACINVEDSRKMIDLHEVHAYPTTVLVDQAGRVYSFRARGPQLERLLERLLAQKK